jgi:hypothetical protein
MKNVDRLIAENEGQNCGPDLIRAVQKISNNPDFIIGWCRALADAYEADEKTRRTIMKKMLQKKEK